MKPPEEVKREFVHEWLRTASGDPKAALHLLNAAADVSYVVAFHAQQASEKYLKSVLVWHQVDFPKTHDIGRIVDLVRSADPRLADLVADADALTRYGVEPRYPSDFPEPTHEQARNAVAIAGRVQQAVLGHLPTEFSASGRA
jgi:HEPN domain-containing protein